MERGACWATVCGVAKGSDTTEQLTLVYFTIFRAKSFSSVVIHHFPCCGVLSNGVLSLLFSQFQLFVTQGL